MGIQPKKLGKLYQLLLPTITVLLKSLFDNLIFSGENEKVVNRRFWKLLLLFFLINPQIYMIQAEEGKELEKKVYISFRPGVRKGAAPYIEIEKPILNDKKKLYVKLITITIQGVWKAKIKLHKTDYDLFEIPEGSYTTEVGAPMLSTISLDINIPSDAKFKGLRTKTTLMKEFNDVFIAPVQEPLPIKKQMSQDYVLNKKKQEFVINREIYKKKSPYPGRFTDIIADNYLGSQHIILLKIFPIQYYPTDKVLKIFSIKINLQFEN